jgi:hypothetical protein
LDAGAFSDDAVVKASEGMIRILVDGDKDNALFGKYGVQAMPTLLFLDPDGKQVGKLGDRQPAGVKKQFEEIVSAHKRGPKGLESATAAFDAGKADSKPVVLLFVDAKPKSEMFKKGLGDAAFKGMFDNVAFCEVAWAKDNEDAKKWKVTEVPRMLVIDPTDGEGKVLKTLTSNAPKSVKAAIDEAVKKLKK